MLYKVVRFKLVGPNEKRSLVMTLSSTKAKYQAITSNTIELKYITNILTELEVSTLHDLIIVCDNVVATYFTVNMVFQSCTKYIFINFHFIHDQVKKRQSRITHQIHTIK